MFRQRANDLALMYPSEVQYLRRSTNWVQARMLKDVDVESIAKKDFDGATMLGSKYEPPPIPEWEGEVEEGLKIYDGNCHCGAICYRLKSKPLEELKIMSCNCSLCSRVRPIALCLPVIPNGSPRTAICSFTPFPLRCRSMAGKI